MTTAPRKEDSRARGVLLGAAVADALGYPFKDYSRTFLQSMARPLTSAYAGDRAGHYPPGQYTDDTQACLAVAEAIVEAGEVREETVADWLIPLWRDLLVVDSPPCLKEAMGDLVRGIKSRGKSGLSPGRAECAPLARAIPVGLWNSGSPEQIARDVESVIRVTHNDPRVLAAAAGVGAVVARNVTATEVHLGSLLDSICNAMEPFHPPLADAVQDFPRILSQTDLVAWELIDGLCPDDAYPPREDGLGEYVVPSFLLALYHFLKCPTSWEEAVSKGIRMGGNTGTMLTLLGAISASHLGEEAIPEPLRAGLVDRTGVERIANDLADARERRRGPAPSPGESPLDPEDS